MKIAITTTPAVVPTAIGTVFLFSLSPPSVDGELLAIGLSSIELEPSTVGVELVVVGLSVGGTVGVELVVVGLSVGRTVGVELVVVGLSVGGISSLKQYDLLACVLMGH